MIYYASPIPIHPFKDQHLFLVAHVDSLETDLADYVVYGVYKIKNFPAARLEPYYVISVEDKAVTFFYLKYSTIIAKPLDDARVYYDEKGVLMWKFSNLETFILHANIKCVTR